MNNMTDFDYEVYEAICENKYEDDVDEDVFNIRYYALDDLITPGDKTEVQVYLTPLHYRSTKPSCTIDLTTLTTTYDFKEQWVENGSYALELYTDDGYTHRVYITESMMLALRELIPANTDHESGFDRLYTVGDVYHFIRTYYRHQKLSSLGI